MNEIEQAINQQKSEMIESEQLMTLKEEPISQILCTFDQNKKMLEDIFNLRRHNLDKFNIGNGMDYLTILWRTVTSEQQKAMYWRMIDAFMEDRGKYIGNPMV